MDEASHSQICPVCEANLDLSKDGWEDGVSCPACSTELRRNERGLLEPTPESTAINVAEQPDHFESLDLDSLLAEEERRKRQELERQREKAEERRRAEEEQKKKEAAQRRLEKTQRKSETPVEPDLPGLQLAQAAEDLDEVAADLDELAVDRLSDSQKRAFGLEDTSTDNQDNDEIWPEALEVEGIAKQLTDERVFGVKCHVCDTLLHARVSQVGTRIECPDCFTSIVVPEAPPSKHSSPEQSSNEANKKVDAKPVNDDGELRLSDPVDLPTSDLPQEFGLDPPQPDLLSPMPSVAEEPDSPKPPEAPAASTGNDEEEDPLRLAPLDDDLESNEDSLEKLEPPTTLSNTARVPATGALQNEESPRKSAPVQRRRSKREALEEISDSNDNEMFESSDVERDMEPFTAENLYSRLVSALTTPGLLIRAGVAILILTVSAVFFSGGESYRAMEEKGGTEWLAMAGNYLLFAGCWLAGMLVLLRAASVLFRDSALGYVTVKNWRITGLEDAKSTFLLFAFSYMIACSPFLGLWLLTKVPLGSGMALLIAPLLLLGAWYNQSPFQVLGLDAFVDVRHSFGDWRWLYTYLTLLAAVSIVGGLIFWFDYWPLYIAAAGMQTISLLAFASLCGWHTGRVVQRIEESA